MSRLKIKRRNHFAEQEAANNAKHLEEATEQVVEQLENTTKQALGQVEEVTEQAVELTGEVLELIEEITPINENELYSIGRKAKK